MSPFLESFVGTLSQSDSLPLFLTFETGMGVFYVSLLLLASIVL